MKPPSNKMSTRAFLRGTTMLEYVSLLGLIGAVVVVSAATLGGDVRDVLGFGGRGMEVAAGQIKGGDTGTNPPPVDGNDGQDEKPEAGQPVILVFSGTDASFSARLAPQVYTIGEDLGGLEEIDQLDQRRQDHLEGWGEIVVEQRPVQVREGTALAIDWGPGAQNCPTELQPAALSETYTCSYADAGPHTVRIDPAIERLWQMSPSLVGVESWGDAPIRTMKSMFESLPAVAHVPNSIPGTVISLDRVFYLNLAIPPEISNWDVGGVRYFSEAFLGAKVDADITGWDMGSAQSLSGMFMSAQFNQPIGNWDVGSVEDMSLMFSSSNFNQPLEDWDVGNVKNLSSMFFNTPFNQDISGWSTGRAENMRMLFSRSTFNQPIGIWDTSSVKDMSAMFGHNTVFNQDITGWDTHNLEAASGMFQGATAFNQNIGIWQVPKLKNLYAMFLGATNLSTDLGKWRPVPTASTHLISFAQDAPGLGGYLTCWNVQGITSRPLNFKTGNFRIVDPKWGQAPGTDCDAPPL